MQGLLLEVISPTNHLPALIFIYMCYSEKKKNKTQLCHQDDSNLFEEKTESPRKRQIKWPCRSRPGPDRPEAGRPGGLSNGRRRGASTVGDLDGHGF